MAKVKPKKSSPLKPQVGIVMGSRSDLDVMAHAARRLEELGIGSDVKVLSAHRAPDALEEWLGGLERRGIKVIIAAAGVAAHLPGVCAAKSTLPVLGVPMPGGALGGQDALYSIVQMPGGIPVGTLAIGKAGAINAALLAASILGIADADIRRAYKTFRSKQTRDAVKNAGVTRQDLGLS